MANASPHPVMPGLVPGIHVSQLEERAEAAPRPVRVDGRAKPGHDSVEVDAGLTRGPFIDSLPRP
ncbi:hypothetical protein [Aquabacter sediminis]|uniref:hypothetical protein n=1 Tax=Aquabacter sediminis TaxID=3029197 RepID=UPI00237EC6C3|nr:hypothetical protein [Aquabacter sp. P-9]MDE1570172.1 hypothetical protein [Aquabacter sp. P-9]